MDGSVNCLGYYLEVAPPATSVSSDDDSEVQGEGEHDELGPDAAPLSFAQPKHIPTVSTMRWHHSQARLLHFPSTTRRQNGSKDALLDIFVVSAYHSGDILGCGVLFLASALNEGGDLHWLWKPYALYQEVDYIYGLKAYEGGDGFTNAQSLLNIVENFMNIAYLYLAHVVGTPVAPLVGFASAVMTLSKTVLYWVQEYYCNGCSVGHNSLQVLVVYWIIPNGLWLVIPSFIIWQFGKDIVASLRVAEKVAAKEVSGKTQ
ncbi:hypothetical protein A0H81_02264 [Grifola frondosa]|uniref:EXPERA domain-containing protein n=1 Tax=Grifola frondosa TaxID=5627 RepID=A0A1C7MNC6_GRIFR|nr:hypothetical protein A0H81_02264 [Grifola frondosa]